MKKVAFFILFLILSTPFVDAHAQSDMTQSADSTLMRIELKDGTSLVGYIIAEDSKEVTIRLKTGSTLTFNRAEIVSIDSLNGKIVNGKFLRLDPNRTRLAFAPTGRTLPKGRGYVSFNYLFFPLVGYGVTDRFTAAVGVSVFPTGEGQLIYAVPKIQLVDSEISDFSIGVLVIDGIGDAFGSIPTLGMAFGSLSLGSEYSAVHLGVGVGFVDGELSDRPLILLGGEYQINNSLKFISENYFVPGFDGVLVSGGVRFFGKNLATDILFLTSNDWGAVVPYFGFAYNFGRN